MLLRGVRYQVFELCLNKKGSCVIFPIFKKEKGCNRYLEIGYFQLPPGLICLGLQWIDHMTEQGLSEIRNKEELKGRLIFFNLALCQSIVHTNASEISFLLCFMHNVQTQT